MSLRSEIFEQPVVLRNLLAEQFQIVRDIAKVIRAHDVRFIFLAARGTSDNAGRYANYLWGSFNLLPTALATPSLFTLYKRPPSLKGALVVGISQSGQSPDIVSVVAEGKRQDCPTLAITNAPDSPLARASDHIIDIRAGHEAAVAATKTYTAELMAIAMLAVALDGGANLRKELALVPDYVEQVLSLDKTIAQVAERYRYMQQCVVLGRGYNYSTAFEWSLKLKELTYVVAEPYSPADFQHGPIAMVESGFPVMAVAPGGMVYENVYELLARLSDDYDAELLVISEQANALALSRAPLELPQGIPEWLTPLVSIVPAQLFAYYLARTKGYSTEAPRIIHKITRTH